MKFIKQLHILLEFDEYDSIIFEYQKTSQAYISKNRKKTMCNCIKYTNSKSKPICYQKSSSILIERYNQCSLRSLKKGKLVKLAGSVRIHLKTYYSHLFVYITISVLMHSIVFSAILLFLFCICFYWFSFSVFLY